MAISQTQRTDLLTLLVGMFDAAPSSDLLSALAEGLENGGTLEAYAANLVNSTEFVGIYSNALTAEEFATKFIANLLGSTVTAETTAAAEEYVAGRINAGASRDVVIRDALTALSGVSEEDPTFGAAVAQLNNKVEVAEYFGTAVQNTGLTLSQMQNVLVGVTSDDATVTAKKEAIDSGSVAGIGGSNSQSFALTTSSDALVGTSNADVFSALVGTNSVNGNTQDTAQSFDAVNGGEGQDTINIASNTANANIGLTLSSVETVNFTAYQAGTVGGTGNFNLSNSTGVETLNNSGSIATFVATNANELANVGVNNVNGQTTEVSFSANAWTGLADAVSLKLNNTTNQAKVTLTGANTIETLNVVTSGSASKVDLGGTAIAGTTTLNVSGSADFSFDDTDGTTAAAALTTIDASALTGKLDADLSNGGAVNLKVTGSAQDDTLTIRNVTKDDVIDLGEGSDKVTTVFTADATSFVPTLTNVETLAVTTTGVDVDVAMNLSKSASLTSLEIGIDDGADGDSVTLTQAAAALAAVNFNAGGVAVDSTLDTLSLGYASTTGTSDAVTLNYTNKDANGNLINSTKGTQLTSAVTVNGVESVTINTDQLHADTNATTQDGGLKLNLTDDKLQTLTVVSSTLVDMSGAALDDSVKVVDASAATGGILLEMDNAADADTTTGKSVTVTTGSGNDTVNDLNGNVATSVSTGAGKDTIVVTDANNQLAANLTIDAGEGDDTITLTTVQSLAANVSLNVTTGAGSDTVTVFGGAVGATTSPSITITDFTVGAAGDRFDLSVNNATDGGTGSIKFQNDGQAIAAGTGLYVVSGDISQGAAATSAQIFNGITTTNINSDNDVIYVAYDDGSNTYIAQVTNNGAAALGDATAVDEVALIATLTGVADATTLTVENFTDFLA